MAHIDLTNFDPTTDRLPNNRFHRRAVASWQRKQSRKEAKRAARKAANTLSATPPGSPSIGDSR